MIIPELPDYLTSLGGAEYKGLIISLFTITAGLSRPFSGKLADTIGRIPVMIFGGLICFITSLMYPIVSGVAGFLFLRFFHGLSTGFTPTGYSAFVADIVPPSKRGEAMGVIGLFNSLGMAIGPFIGSKIAAAYDVNVLFYSSSLMGLVAVSVLFGLRETLQNKQPFKAELLKVNHRDFVEPRVIGPAITFLLTAFSFGVILTIIPDFTMHLGLTAGNKGIFFSVFTLSSLFIRFAAGKLSDRFGRVPVLRVSSTSLACAMLFLGFADSAIDLVIGAALFGFSVGMNSPTIFAWTIDLSLDTKRGRGLATMYIALEIGIGLGAYLSAFVYDNNSEQFKYAFWLAAALSGIASIYLFTLKKQRLKT